MPTSELQHEWLDALVADARHTEQLSSAASGTASNVVMNVRMVSGMMGEMLRAVSEVRDRVTESQKQALRASDGTADAIERVANLGGVVERIGATAKLVGRIAQETNMLALNATIEASRAGQAGAGFGVVAKEVKALSQQTSQATSDIHLHLGSIRKANDEVVASVGSVRQELASIQGLVTAVERAVAEQAKNLETITSFANEAAASVEGIVNTLDSVASAARLTLEKVELPDGPPTA